MALDKLALYNGALLELGQRKLSSLTENRPPRYYLDQLWDEGAVSFCFETVKPVFARTTTHLTSGSTPSVLGYDEEYSLPADYVTIVGLYHDSKLKEPVHRYVIEQNKLFCDTSDDSVYLRYISSDHLTSFTYWTEVFVSVVKLYLAQKLARKFAPDEYEKLSAELTDAVKIAVQESEKQEPTQTRGKTTTLTATWKQIYNDALLVMGKGEITDLDADTDTRAKLDAAFNADLVESLLEGIGWLFALTSTKTTYDPSAEPSWGFQRVHALPADLLRLDGVFQDEYFQVPLKNYAQENGRIFADLNELYIQYVSQAWLTNPTMWPAFFRRLVGARLAMDAAKSLEGDYDRARQEYRDRESEARGNDAVASPPRTLSRGNWISARYRNWYRGRP